MENNHFEGNMKKMLLLEDDDLSVNVMRRIFRDAFEISVCDSAEYFYEKYRDNKFDIIIMDISLKGSKNGLELIKEIKKDPSYNGAPVLCLTAHAQNKTRLTALESGSGLFMTKPINNKILKEAVEFLLKSKPPETKMKI